MWVGYFRRKIRNKIWNKIKVISKFGKKMRKTLYQKKTKSFYNLWILEPKVKVGYFIYAKKGKKYKKSTRKNCKIKNNKTQLKLVLSPKYVTFDGVCCRNGQINNFID